MPGLDHSDVIAFMRVIDAPPSDIAARAAGFIETVQDKLKGYEAHIAAAPEDRLLYERPVKRYEELLVRLKSPDPWAYWPFLPDEYLHVSAAWASHGYWQGFFEDTDCRFSLVKRQWNGSGIASSITAFGLPDTEPRPNCRDFSHKRCARLPSTRRCCTDMARSGVWAG
jgi:hypothetical protein